MNSSQISLVLEDFINKKNPYKSILIDGSWGCGKTFIIKKFIKEHRCRKIIYISLFGKRSVDEINNELFFKNRRVISFVSKILNKNFVKSTKKKYVPVVYAINKSLDFALSDSKKIRKRTVVVFDDIDRISNNITYSDLLGYFNSIILCRCKIICIITSCKNMDDERKKSLRDFVEKVFERMILIDKSNDETINELFEECGFNDICSIYNPFNFDIRLALKVRNFYKDIIQLLKEENLSLEDNNISEIMLLKACFCVINEFVNNYEPIKEPKEYIDYIENKVLSLANIDKYTNDFCMPNFGKLVIGLAKIYLNNNNKELIRLFSEISEDKNYMILKQDMFYLSEKHKEEYVNKFLEYISKNNIKWNLNLINKLRSIVFNKPDMLKEKELDLIAKSFVNDADFNTDQIKYELNFLDGDSSNRITEFVDYLENKIQSYKIENKLNELKNMVEVKDYKNMSIFIEKLNDIDKQKNDYISKFILSNNFLLPDLSGDINVNVWTFCHSIAKYAFRYNIKTEFIECCKKIVRKYNNELVLQRCYYLIYYNVDKLFKKESLSN